MREFLLFLSNTKGYNASDNAKTFFVNGTRNYGHYTNGYQMLVGGLARGTNIDDRHLGPYRGDIIVGVGPEAGFIYRSSWSPANYDLSVFQGVGEHWLEVFCNGTWTITVEQPREVKRGSLPRTMHSEVGKSNYAYSIYVPSGGVNVSFNLTMVSPLDGQGRVDAMLWRNDGPLTWIGTAAGYYVDGNGIEQYQRYGNAPICSVTIASWRRGHYIALRRPECTGLRSRPTTLRASGR